MESTCRQAALRRAWRGGSAEGSPTARRYQKPRLRKDRVAQGCGGIREGSGRVAWRTDAEGSGRDAEGSGRDPGESRGGGIRRGSRRDPGESRGGGIRRASRRDPGESRGGGIRRGSRRDPGESRGGGMRRDQAGLGVATGHCPPHPTHS